MADYTLCANIECNMKEKCGRFLGKPGKYQSMSIFEGGEKCDSFWEEKEYWHKKYDYKKALKQRTPIFESY